MRNTHNQFHVTMRSSAPSKPWLESNLSVTLPAADGARPGHAAPDPGAARARRGYAPGGALGLGGDLALSGRGRLGAHALGAGDSALRPPAARCLDVALRGRPRCRLP